MICSSLMALLRSRSSYDNDRGFSLFDNDRDFSLVWYQSV